MTVVKCAIRDVNHHVFVPFSLRILLGGDTDYSGYVAGGNHHGAAERLIIQSLARGTGDQVIHRQCPGMITRAGNQQSRPVVPGIFLLLHRHGIHGSDADDREFIVDDENLRLNRCSHRESVVRRHGEDEVFNPLDVPVLVGPNHDQPLGLSRRKCEVIRDLDVVQIVFRAAGNDIRNLQRLTGIANAHQFHDGNIPAVLVGKPVEHRDRHLRQGKRIVVLDIKCQLPGSPGHPVVGGLIIICLHVDRAGIPTGRRDLAHARDNPRVDPEHDLLGALKNIILLDRHLDLHLVESRRKIKLPLGNVRLGVPVQGVVRLKLRPAPNDEAHLQRFHQATGACHRQKCRQSRPLTDHGHG